MNYPRVGSSCVFSVKAITVWALFSHPDHYHSYHGPSDAFRARIREEIKLCQLRLDSDLGQRTGVRLRFCTLEDVVSLSPLKLGRPDVVLFLMESRNFEEGLYDPPLQEVELKAHLKALAIPYTGCDGLSLFSDYDKSLQYSLALSCGIPVPDQAFISDNTDLNGHSWSLYPAFIKPCLHGDSIGIRASSIVRNDHELLAEIQRLRALFPHEPLVVQEYLQGEEFTVGVMGNWNSTDCHTLPVIRIGFDQAMEGVSVLTHHAKNDPQSSEYMQDFYLKAQLDLKLEQQLSRDTLAIFRRLKGRGYARADWRLDRHGNAKFLEINALPDILDDTSSIVKMYRSKTGKGHSDFLLDIIKHAIQ
jgi:D-alanine-D-alanine ligase-like ATP-grasp enzyme